jgi:membrane protein
MKGVSFAKRVVRGALDDNIMGEAAKAAFYFFLSLFPMLIVLFAFTGLFGGEQAFDRIMDWLQDALPEDALGFVEDPVREVTEQRNPAAFSFGILIAVWAASNFFAALGDSLDNMFDARGGSWWKKRLKAVLLMFVGGSLLFGSAFVLISGPQLAAAVGVSGIMQWLAWPIVFIMLVALLWAIYYILPAYDQSERRRELLVGAVAGTVLWLIATAGFRMYVGGFADYSRLYGIVGGVIVLLMWLYITAFVILLGGEIAEALIERREHGERDRTGGDRDRIGASGASDQASGAPAGRAESPGRMSDAHGKRSQQRGAHRRGR